MESFSGFFLIDTEGIPVGIENQMFKLCVVLDPVIKLVVAFQEQLLQVQLPDGLVLGCHVLRPQLLVILAFGLGMFQLE